jgi:hypothetical protein
MKKGNKDLTDQPLTSSTWGKRVYDKPHKELWWWIQENICEIVSIGLMVITIIAIVLAWIYETKNA